MRIVAATKNKGKIREINAILKDTPYGVISMEEIGITIDVNEDAGSFEGNAMKKAEEIMKLCGEVTLADDSGLCVDALGGAPGVYSARYAGTHGSDLDNNLLLLKNMEGVTNRTARFVCAIAVAFPDGRRICVQSTFEGEISREMKGTGGFGYDVLFYLPEYGQTAAEIPAELKNQISHRAKALQLLKLKLEETEG